MQQGIVNEAGLHFRELMSETMRQLKLMQPTRPGTRPRSPQEEAAVWRKLIALPDEEFEPTMDFIAAKVGHEMGEEKPCELCRFIIKHAGDV